MRSRVEKWYVLIWIMSTVQKAEWKVSIGYLFLDIMELTADKINYDKNILPSLLKILQCLRLNAGGINGDMTKNKQ